MSDQIRKTREAVTEIHWTLRGTRVGGRGLISVSAVVDADGTFEEGPVRIMDKQEQILRGKTVRLVKVLWHNRGVEEATW